MLIPLMQTGALVAQRSLGSGDSLPLNLAGDPVPRFVQLQAIGGDCWIRLDGDRPDDDDRGFVLSDRDAWQFNGNLGDVRVCVPVGARLQYAIFN